MLNCLAHDFLKPKYYLYKKFSKKFKNTIDRENKI